MKLLIHFNALIRNAIFVSLGVIISLSIEIPYDPPPPILEIWITIFVATNLLPFAVLFINYFLKSTYDSIDLYEDRILFQSGYDRLEVKYSDIESIEKISSYEKATSGFLPWVEGRFFYYEIVTGGQTLTVTSFYKDIFSGLNLKINKRTVFYPFITQ